MVAKSNDVLLQEQDLCSYISYKWSDFLCSFLTLIHAGRTPKTLCKLCRGEKLVVVQEKNSWRECIHILDSPYLSTKIRHNCLSHELTLQVFAVLLLAQSSPWPDDSYQLGTCLTPDPVGSMHKVFSLPHLPVWPDSAGILWTGRAPQNRVPHAILLNPAAQ